MLLTPHFLVGATLAKYIPEPAVALTAALISHYLLDQVPHWHYFPKAEDHPLKKPLWQSGRWSALIYVSADLVLAGVLLVFLDRNSWLIWLGGLLAILPDGLLFLSWQFPQSRILSALQAFHDALHIIPRNAPALPLGVPLQGGTALFSFLLLLF